MVESLKCKLVSKVFKGGRLIISDNKELFKEEYKSVLEVTKGINNNG